MLAEQPDPGDRGQPVASALPGGSERRGASPGSVVADRSDRWRFSRRAGSRRIDTTNLAGLVRPAKNSCSSPETQPRPGNNWHSRVEGTRAVGSPEISVLAGSCRKAIECRRTTNDSKISVRSCAPRPVGNVFPTQSGSPGPAVDISWSRSSFSSNRVRNS